MNNNKQLKDNNLTTRKCAGSRKAYAYYVANLSPHCPEGVWFGRYCQELNCTPTQALKALIIEIMKKGTLEGKEKSL